MVLESLKAHDIRHYKARTDVATGNHEKHSHSTPPGWLAKQTYGGHHHHDENFRPPWLGGLVRWLLSTHLLYHDFIEPLGAVQQTSNFG